MILKSIRVAALAVAVLGSAAAAQAAESMMDKPVAGKNTTMTSPDTGGPIQKAGATKHGAMMSHKKPKKHSMHPAKPMSHDGMMSKPAGSMKADSKGSM